MKSVPKISKYMSTQPFTIGLEQPLDHTAALMREHHIQHFPVLQKGELVGVLSDRDLKFYQGLMGTDMHEDKVADVCHTDVYAVSPDAPLDEVAATMAQHHYGCAVVTDKKKVVGIFTANDGLKVLSDQLQARHK